MNSTLKALLVSVLAGGVFVVLLRKFASKPLRALERIPPPRDAEPTIEEPLRESDLRVAQNSPL